jgi:hypothetical protein
VIGVIDDFLPRPETRPPQRELERDEALRATREEGQPFVEIVSGEEGPSCASARRRAARAQRQAEHPRRRARSRGNPGNARGEASDRVCLVGELVEQN